MIYQFAVIVLPFLLLPYLSRTLGADGNGIYAYTASYAIIFAFFANFGIMVYGTRKIASVSNDPQKLKETFASILVLKLIMSGIILLAYLTLVFLMGEYQLFFLIQGITIFKEIFDVNFYFMGNENFKGLSIRNTIVRTSVVVLVLFFVKNVDDLLKYIIIVRSIDFISQIAMWPSLIKTGIFKDFKNTLKRITPLYYFKDALWYFLPNIAVMLYTTANVTILGLINSEGEVAFFDYSFKITNAVVSILTSLGGILLPKITRLIHENKLDDVQGILNRSTRYLTFLCFPFTIGLISIAPVFIPWFLGDGWQGAIIVLMIASFRIVFCTFNNVTGMQFMIPYGMKKEFLISSIIGAAGCLIITLSTVYFFGAIGAILGSVFAEIIVLICHCVFLKKTFKIHIIILKQYKIIIASIIIGTLVVLYNQFFYNDFLMFIFDKIDMVHFILEAFLIAIIILISGLLYLIILAILKDGTQKELIKYIFNRKNKQMLEE